MNKPARLVTLGAALMLVGCSPVAKAGSDCAEELRAAAPVEYVLLDIEDMLVGAVEEIGTKPQWGSIKPIATSCEAPATMPGEVKDSDRLNKDAPKPVRIVNISGSSGVVFAYLSRGDEEVTTGFSAALVKYDDEGAPGQAYRATEILRGEGWGRHTNSKISATAVRRCSQELEYFIYSEAGDVLDELDSPSRGPYFCEELISISPEN